MSAPLTASADAPVATEYPPSATGFWRRALHHRSFVLGGALALMVPAAALTSLIWTPWSAYDIDIAAKLLPPSAAHWLGTDALGRDIVSLLLVGARATILVGVIAVGIALPNFWFAILLILLFSVKLQWLSAGGFAGWNDGVWVGIRSLLLPAISLAVVQAAILARVTRSAVLEVLREDFVRTARAKGLSRRAVLWQHVLRNAMIPVMTVMGLQFANLLAGTIVIENVFYLPGLGRLIFQSIANRDLIVVRNCVMLLAAMVVIVNFVVDVLYAFIDPRIKVHNL